MDDDLKQLTGMDNVVRCQRPPIPCLQHVVPGLSELFRQQLPKSASRNVNMKDYK